MMAAFWYLIAYFFGFIYAAGFGATFIVYTILGRILGRNKSEVDGWFWICLMWPVVWIMSFRKL